jgi:hypothetical protein
MTDERGHLGQSGQGGSEGRHGQAEGDRPNPWAPPEEKLSLHKTPEPPPAQPSAAQQPTVSSAPGSFGPPAAQPPYPAGPYGHHGPPQPAGYGYGHPGYGGGMPGAPWAAGPSLPTGTSTAAMVLGIIGLVLTASCYGSVLAVFVAPVALGLGISARRKVAAGIQGGSGQATAGFIMGIVGTVLSLVVAALVVFGFVVALNADPHGPYDDSPYGNENPYNVDASGPVPTLVVTR